MLHNAKILIYGQCVFFFPQSTYARSSAELRERHRDSQESTMIVETWYESTELLRGKKVAYIQLASIQLRFQATKGIKGWQFRTLKAV